MRNTLRSPLKNNIWRPYKAPDFHTYSQGWLQCYKCKRNVWFGFYWVVSLFPNTKGRWLQSWLAGERCGLFPHTHSVCTWIHLLCQYIYHKIFCSSLFILIKLRKVTNAHSSFPQDFISFPCLPLFKIHIYQETS